MIKHMTTDENILKTFPAIFQLRPFLKEEEYLERVKDQQDNYGWHLVALFEGEEIACVAGYKFSRSFHFDRYMYVDDLVVDEKFRSQGIGDRMMRWLEDECRGNGCAHLRLDSGVQRHKAHRFYLNQRMDITCHHLIKEIAEESLTDIAKK